MYTFLKPIAKKAFTSDSESFATQKYCIFCVAGKSQYNIQLHNPRLEFTALLSYSGASK
jgi:hypothetical protein